jgi:RecA-family ATPase
VEGGGFVECYITLALVVGENGLGPGCDGGLKQLIVSSENGKKDVLGIASNVFRILSYTPSYERKFHIWFGSLLNISGRIFPEEVHEGVY